MTLATTLLVLVISLKTLFSLTVLTGAYSALGALAIMLDTIQVLLTSQSPPLPFPNIVKSNNFLQFLSAKSADYHETNF